MFQIILRFVLSSVSPGSINEKDRLTSEFKVIFYSQFWYNIFHFLQVNQGNVSGIFVCPDAGMFLTLFFFCAYGSFAGDFCNGAPRRSLN